MTNSVAQQPARPMAGAADAPGTRRRHLLTSIVVLAVSCLVSSACSSLRTLDVPENELQSRIRAGELLEAGERVQLITSDGSERELLVTGIDDDTIHGDGERVPIEDVVAIKTRRIHAGKTALLAGGIVGTLTLIAILVTPAAVLAASAP